MQIRLKVLKGTKAGKEIKLPVPECLIGRGDGCHLRPRNEAISQRHCLIMTTDSEVVVRDLKSLNGTYVNGEKVIEETALRSGDQLRIGPLVFEVVIELPKAARPAVHDLKELEHGTAGGNANLSTLVVEASKRLGRFEITPAVEAELPMQASLLAGTMDPSLLEPGQSVVVADGLLQGATGIVVKRVDDGHYLVSLTEQGGQIWARIPAHLLRAT